MIHVFFGENDFAIKGELDRIKLEAGPAELTSANTEVLEAKGLTPIRLLEICNTSPFFFGKRLVLVNGLLSKFERPESRSAKALPQTEQTKKELSLWRESLPHLKNIPETTILIFIDGKLNQGNPALKLLSPLAEVKLFAPLSGDELNAWIKSRVKISGGDISPRAVSLLTELSGSNLWVLYNEINKLVLYCGQRQITERDIDKLTPLVREASIFSLVDSIIEKKAASAFRYLNQLLKLGATHPYILTMIAWRLRLLFRAKELLEEKADMQQVITRLGQSSVASSILLKKARLYSYKRLLEIHTHLLQTDTEIKSGMWNDEMALQLLIADLCR